MFNLGTLHCKCSKIWYNYRITKLYLQTYYRCLFCRNIIDSSTHVRILGNNNNAQLSEHVIEKV